MDANRLSIKVFEKEMKRLSEIFGIGTTKERMLAYYNVLKNEISDVSFVESCNEIARTERFFPVPATILGNSKAITKEEILKKYGF